MLSRHSIIVPASLDARAEVAEAVPPHELSIEELFRIAESINAKIETFVNRYIDFAEIQFGSLPKSETDGPINPRFWQGWLPITLQ